MSQESATQYYMVIDEKSTGPFTLDEVTLHPKLTPETLVWKPGLENWVPAQTLAELLPAFANFSQNQDQRPPEYNQNIHQENHNPYNRNHYGENHEHNRFSENPQYRNDYSYYHNQNPYRERNDRYQNGYRPGMRTNWLPWAIVATVVGFFTSCIGAIFGIIAIVQANKANTLYAQGYDREGDAANSNAKIMTIIGLILAGIGIIIAFSFGGLIGNLSNLSYL